MSALASTLRPSAYAAISPYSMPLWTIFTKWPAPLGPQCSQPCSAVLGATPSRTRLGVRGADSTPGASASKIGASRCTGGVGAADHQAVAALEAVDAAARADVEVVDAVVGEQRAGAVDVVAVPRVAAVDDRVAGFEQRSELVDRVADVGGRHHQPDVAGRGQPLDERSRRLRAGHALVGERVDGGVRHVVAHALVPGGGEPAHHVGAHPPEPDHAQLHARLPPTPGPYE